VDASLPPQGLVTTSVIVSASLIAAVTDVLRFKVYNVLTFPLMLSGLLFHATVGGESGLYASTMGLGAALFLLMLPYVFGILGAGDVKFVAALGAWVGIYPMLAMLLIGCVVTGVYGVGVMLFYGGHRQVWNNLIIICLRLRAFGRTFSGDDAVEPVQLIARQDDRRRRLIPFTAMVSVGVLLTLLLMRGLSG
jgi:prepilin peptidase CpaA